MDKQYQYKRLTDITDFYSDIEAVVNRYGREGWRVIKLESHENDAGYVWFSVWFEREIPELDRIRDRIAANTPNKESISVRQ